MTRRKLDQGIQVRSSSFIGHHARSNTNHNTHTHTTKPQHTHDFTEPRTRTHTELGHAHNHTKQPPTRSNYEEIPTYNNKHEGGRRVSIHCDRCPFVAQIHHETKLNSSSFAVVHAELQPYSPFCSTATVLAILFTFTMAASFVSFLSLSLAFLCMCCVA